MVQTAIQRLNHRQPRKTIPYPHRQAFPIRKTKTRQIGKNHQQTHFKTQLQLQKHENNNCRAQRKGTY